jgi:hypothetical protein
MDFYNCASSNGSNNCQLSFHEVEVEWIKLSCLSPLGSSPIFTQNLPLTPKNTKLFTKVVPFTILIDWIENK